jgi:hypothetical protein
VGYERRAVRWRARTRRQIIIIIVFDCQRTSGPPCAGRTSGRDASAGYAGAPLAIRDLESDRESQSVVVVRWEAAEMRRGPPGFPGRPSVTSTCGSRHPWEVPPRVPVSRPTGGQLKPSRRSIHDGIESDVAAFAAACGRLCRSSFLTTRVPK